jgi:hypothetical protein
VGNVIENSTDIDVVFGACRGCDIQDNVIRHRAGDTAFASSSFAAVMLHGWPPSDHTDALWGDYTDTDVSGNVIDCGGRQACGFGVLVGSAPWYVGPTWGGYIHDNTIAHAVQGIAIAGLTGPTSLARNQVLHSGRSNASCQLAEDVPVATTARAIAPDSVKWADLTQDSPTEYHARDFAGCLLNSWRLKSCSERGGVLRDAPCKHVLVTHDADYCCAAHAD